MIIKENLLLGQGGDKHMKKSSVLSFVFPVLFLIIMRIMVETTIFEPKAIRIVMLILLFILPILGFLAAYQAKMKNRFVYWIGTVLNGVLFVYMSILIMIGLGLTAS